MVMPYCGRYPDTAGIDVSRFHYLVDLAGHSMALNLIENLVTDLQTVRAGLSRAFDGPDWQQLRRQSHVLIGLSGTFGMPSLQAAAERLNLFAKRAEPVGVFPLRSEIMPQIARLIGVAQSVAAGLGERS